MDQIQNGRVDQAVALLDESNEELTRALANLDFLLIMMDKMVDELNR